jgi:hypothetical protein
MTTWLRDFACMPGSIVTKLQVGKTTNANGSRPFMLAKRLFNYLVIVKIVVCTLISSIETRPFSP